MNKMFTKAEIEADRKNFVHNSRLTFWYIINADLTHPNNTISTLIDYYDVLIPSDRFAVDALLAMAQD